MVDKLTATTGNDNDDWEVAVDTGEFDKRLEQQEKDRAATQESILSSASSTINDDNNGSSSNINLMQSNKPIRILKRPTSQSQLPTTTDMTNSHMTTIATHNNSNSPFSNTTSASTTVPVISIIPRNQTKDSINSSQSTTSPTFASVASSSQSTKPAIKTYEQRELEYRLARLRIMGEEESSAKDDDDDPPIELTSDEPTKTTTSSTFTSAKTPALSQSSLQTHSTPGSYASNLYTLNNTGTIHFTPNTNSIGPFSSSNFPQQQHYHGPYSAPYSQMPFQPPPPPLPPHYPITTTATLYMTSTTPFVNASSSSNNWYHYQHEQTPYGTQQYGHPQ